MQTKASLGARLRYGFDKTMARGPIALIGWLALLALAVVLVAGLVLSLTGIAPEGGAGLSFGEGAWASLTRMLDPGAMGGDTGWAFRVVMLAVTLAGLFIVSALIAVLACGFGSGIAAQRRGRSPVLESGHTVILNWSPAIFDLIAELAVANEGRRRPRIVVMAAKDKAEMEEAIAGRIADLFGTRIICRSGDPTDLHDLSIVNPHAARSVIVLSPEGEDADSQVVKTILALAKDRRRGEERIRIAAEIRDGRNADLARLAGGDEVRLVLADELIARIMVHSTRQAGLGAVYGELLDFDGREIYTIEQPVLAGVPFGQALSVYGSCAPIGFLPRKGGVMLNPPMDMPIPEGAKMILIAEDDDRIVLGPRPPGVNPAVIREAATPPRGPERTLLLGWNRRAPIVAQELSRLVAPGSLLTVIADAPELERLVGGIRLFGGNMRVEYCAADSSSRAVLDGFDVPSYDHVLVLGSIGHLPAQAADTRTLVTLLHLRRIAEASGRHVGVVSEMIDARNRELAEVGRADDFVVGNTLVSLMLSQAAEKETMAAIFDSLIVETGSAIQLRPVSDYVAVGVPLDFYTVVEAARRRGETAIGYRRREAAAAGGGRSPAGVTINPVKTEPVVYTAEDRLVVLARPDRFT